ncbi:MAG: hypothetical protein ACXVCE_17480 [Bacteriovorax sp.]
MKLVMPLIVTLTSCFAFAQVEYDLDLEGDQARTQYLIMQGDPNAKLITYNGTKRLSVQTEEGSILSCVDLGLENRGRPQFQCFAKIRGISQQ